MKPIALVPWAPGTNCHLETVAELNDAGARARVVHLPRLIDGSVSLTDADLIVWPGGFSFGDHGGSGNDLAIVLKHRLGEQLQLLREKRVPMLGICNGFQVMVRAGFFGANLTLDRNQSARFEHFTWTRVAFANVHCLWTTSLQGAVVEMPTAHGEGRPVGSLRHVREVALYGTISGTTQYPISPNGSRIAGICDETGSLMGMMPHPERGGEDAKQIFRNGVAAVR